MVESLLRHAHACFDLANLLPTALDRAWPVWELPRGRFELRGQGQFSHNIFEPCGVWQEIARCIQFYTEKVIRNHNQILGCWNANGCERGASLGITGEGVFELFGRGNFHTNELLMREILCRVDLIWIRPGWSINVTNNCQARHAMRFCSKCCRKLPF